MADEIIVASTTDSAEQIQAALEHGVKAPVDDEVLSTEGDENPVVEETPPAQEEVVVEGKEEKKDEKAGEDKLAVETKVEKTDDDDQLGQRAKKRIARLVAEREDANRRAAAAEARAKALEDEKKPAEKKAEDAAATEDAAWLAAHPEPKQDDFTDYDVFSKEWTAWKVDQREQVGIRKATEAGRAAAAQVLKDAAEKDEADRAATARTEQFQRFEETREEARGRYADFDDQILAAKDLKLSPEMQFVIMDSPVGHDISYWLATHKDEASDLAALSGPEATRELGRLERTIELQVEAMAGGDEKPADVVPAKKVAATKAAEPIRPVGGRSVATKVDMNDPNLPYPEYKRLRDASDAARRKGRR